eukprot:c27078_g1_i1.p1 GENE.c27078_g1_i1~~c27078_g1_i1.p1  ORF type:complete len:400 (+),score=84.20 c27078_g1_i1:124-1323(+)
MDPSSASRTRIAADSKLAQMIEDVVLRLKRRQIRGSFNCADETLKLLRSIISIYKWQTAQDLIDYVREIGLRLEAAQPIELSTGCMVRRVLHVIRTEYDKAIVAAAAGATTDAKSGSWGAEEPGRSPKQILSSPATPRVGAGSLHAMLGEDAVFAGGFDQRLNIKTAILGIVREMIDEDMPSLHSQIADNATEFVHTNEVIMTYGYSRSLCGFLLSAAEKRTFEVIVAESAPSLEGHRLAAELAARGVQTTVITDSAVFAMMAQVSKVVVACHALMANGGIVALSGGHMLALAAKRFSVPFVVVTGIYKLVPSYPYDEDEVNVLCSPEAVLPFEDGELVGAVTAVSPAFDYVPPDLVSLFVSNLEKGLHNPSYIYRLLAEFYSPEDYSLEPADGAAASA